MGKYNKQIVLNFCGNNPKELELLIGRLKSQIEEAQQYNTANKKREVKRLKEFVIFCENILGDFEK
jgi:hypothetical protein